VTLPRWAVVRTPGDSFARALSHHPEGHSIDPERARAQHAGYRATLQRLGLKVLALPPDEELPDSCFTQDLAIALDGRALLCRPGAPSRQPEPSRIASVLEEIAQTVEEVEAPATIEGGDVIRIGDRFVVGHSERTNDEGLGALRRFARADAEVIAAEVRGPYLHLLSGLGVAGDAVLGSEGLIDQPAFSDLEKVAVPEEDAAGCNFVVLEGDVVMASGFAAVRKLVEDRGFRVHELDLSEFAKADGGPTCLSLLI
jgi:dimethylargininase